MSKKPTILIVDDDEDFLGSLVGLIGTWDIVDVKTAGDGEQALQILNSESDIDLVLSDYMMPEMDGLTLKEQLNENPASKAIPFVMISGYGTPRLLDMAVGRGIEEWYDKPVEVDVLKGLLKKYLNISA